MTRLCAYEEWEVLLSIRTGAGDDSHGRVTQTVTEKGSLCAVRLWSAGPSVSTRGRWRASPLRPTLAMADLQPRRAEVADPALALATAGCRALATVVSIDWQLRGIITSVNADTSFSSPFTDHAPASNGILNDGRFPPQ